MAQEMLNNRVNEIIAIKKMLGDRENLNWYPKSIVDELKKELADQKEINRKEILRHIELDEKNIALALVMEKAKNSMIRMAYGKEYLELNESIQHAEQTLEKFRLENEKGGIKQ